MPCAGGQRRLRRAVVDWQIHRNLRNANGAHHSATGIQQSLIFLVFGTRTAIVIIRLVGPRTALNRSERILRLTQNRLPRSRKTFVIRLRGSERIIRLRIRPARNRSCGLRRRTRQLHCGTVLQCRRKPTNADCGDDQQCTNRIHHAHTTAIPAAFTHLIGNVDRLIKRRLPPAHSRRFRFHQILSTYCFAP